MSFLNDSYSSFICIKNLNWILFVEPLPKPRVATSTGPASGQLTPAGEVRLVSSASSTSRTTQSSVNNQTTHAGKDVKTRGKRPVPLPRRLSSISSPSQSSSTPPSPASTGLPTPSPSPSPLSLSSGQSPAPSHFFAKSRENSAKKPNVGQGPATPRRKASGDVPTPTANFKSYRRIPSTSSSVSSSSEATHAPSSRVSNTETGQGSHRQLKFTPRQKQPAPLPGSGSKQKSVTRLSFDNNSGYNRAQPRSDSGLGHSSVSSADSVRMSSVSSSASVESPPGVQCTGAPVRIVVKQEYKKRPSSSYYEWWFNDNCGWMCLKSAASQHQHISNFNTYQMTYCDDGGTQCCDKSFTNWK